MKDYGHRSAGCHRIRQRVFGEVGIELIETFVTEHEPAAGLEVGRVDEQPRAVGPKVGEGERSPVRVEHHVPKRACQQVAAVPVCEHQGQMVPWEQCLHQHVGSKGVREFLLNIAGVPAIPGHAIVSRRQRPAAD
jgi:Rieske Fe-S protein